jgi:hypothetical protein
VAQRCIHLAGRPFFVRSADADRTVHLPAAYGPFCSPHGDACAGRVLVHAAGSAIALPPPDRMPLAWTGPTWRAGTTVDGGWCIQIHSAADGHWHTVAHADPDFGTCRLLQIAGRRAEPSPYALNYPSDQALLSNRLARLGVCVVHGSSLAIDGGGYLFCGRSGIGKTTIARLWRRQGAILLNDDRSLVHIGNEGALLSASPWHGEDPEINALTVPLRAIFHLGQSADNRLGTLSPAVAAARLAANSVLPFYLEASLASALDVIARLAERVPSHQLDFAPDDRALDLVRREVIGR